MKARKCSTKQCNNPRLPGYRICDTCFRIAYAALEKQIKGQKHPPQPKGKSDG